MSVFTQFTLLFFASLNAGIAALNASGIAVVGLNTGVAVACFGTFLFSISETNA